MSHSNHIFAKSSAAGCIKAGITIGAERIVYHLSYDPSFEKGVPKGMPGSAGHNRERTIEDAKKMCDRLLREFTFFIPKACHVDVEFTIKDAVNNQIIDSFKWEKVTAKKANQQVLLLTPKILDLVSNTKKYTPVV